jgi:hypothetical protein
VRDKLNGSPAAQIGLIAILVIAGFVFLTKSGGGGEEEEAAAPTEATVSVAGSGATATATGATPGEAVEGAVEGALESATGEASEAAIAASIPVPPLPAPVASAYDANKTVALLIVHDGGIDDRLVAGSAAGLAALPDVATFVVPAAQISRYAAITLGAGVQRVPALVVMRPKRLSGGAPQASVDYGFQTPQSIVQAVLDASYNGPEATYHPN